MKCPVTESRSLDQGRFMETKHLIMERGGEQQEKSPTYLPVASKQCRNFLAPSVLGSDYNKKDFS